MATSSIKSSRRAVIDVGTNSVKLLLANVAGRAVEPVREQSRQTRLGSGFYETCRLQPEAISRTAAAAAEFASIARDWNAESIRVIATSAARDAVNRAELVDALQRATGSKVEIVSGDLEAQWVFDGVSGSHSLGSQPLVILELGGGSAEFIVGQGGRKQFHAVFDVGTVRLIEQFPHSDPPRPEEFGACRDWLQAFLASRVRPALEPALRLESRQLVGTGGTSTILARMDAKLDTFDRQLIEGQRLSRDRICWHRDHLWQLPLAERQHIAGLPANRADVILPGVAIFAAVMETFGFTELWISTRGLRFGAVMDTAATS